MSEVFIINEDQSLVPLTEQPYDSEDLLQSLLARYPSLLAGDQVEPTQPRKWILIKREAEIGSDEGSGGRWSLDHLFLDQDGVPTLVEVKRSSDTRIRREVVGQMLDYAANCIKYWSIDNLRAFFNATCEDSQQDPAAILMNLIGDEEPEDYWNKVKTNLLAGRLRMLFVADEIPTELKRIIEFLNEQMDPAEVLGLEIKQFVGGRQKTLVPKIIGQTTEASDRKRTGTPLLEHKWKESDLYEHLAEMKDDAAIAGARQLMDWVNKTATRVWWGNAKYPSCTPIFESDGKKLYLMWVAAGATNHMPRVELPFSWWRNMNAFSTPESREELRLLFNQIPGVSIPREKIGGSPAIPLRLLASPTEFCAFTNAMAQLIHRAGMRMPTTHTNP